MSAEVGSTRSAGASVSRATYGSRSVRAAMASSPPRPVVLPIATLLSGDRELDGASGEPETVASDHRLGADGGDGDDLSGAHRAARGQDGHVRDRGRSTERADEDLARVGDLHRSGAGVGRVPRDLWAQVRADALADAHGVLARR